MMITGAIPCDKIKMREVYMRKLKREYGQGVKIQIEGDLITYSFEVSEDVSVR